MHYGHKRSRVLVICFNLILIKHSARPDRQFGEIKLQRICAAVSDVFSQIADEINFEECDFNRLHLLVSPRTIPIA